MVRRKLLALASGMLLAGGLAIGLPGAHAATVEPTSWGKANLLSYDDSDFENGISGWVAYGTNTTVSQDTTHAYLHSDSLKLTATASGSSAAKAEMNGNQINVTGGDTYRVSAWVKTGSAVSGRTVTFALGSFDSANTWLGWTSGTSNTLASTTRWQYVSETITEPSTAAYVLGSPRITEAGVGAGETLNVDEVLFEPYRAATVIGAEDTSGNCGAFSTANTTIGPLQSCKIFYSPTTSLPSSYNGSTCASLPFNVTCVISYKVQNTNVASFVGSIPAGKNVLLTYWQEPENDTFSTCNGVNKGSNGANYVCQFEAQSNLIRSSVTSANKENVFVFFDGMTYQYDSGTSHNLGGGGGGCYFVPPASYADFYLADHYEFTASGKNLANDSSNGEWNGWLGCVQPQNKPIGLAEIGYNCGQKGGTGSNPNGATTAQAMAADNTYLGGEPDGLPVVLYEYWWDSNVGCQFTASGPVTQWQSLETQNGGGGN